MIYCELWPWPSSPIRIADPLALLGRDIVALPACGMVVFSADVGIFEGVHMSDGVVYSAEVRVSVGVHLSDGVVYSADVGVSVGLGYHHDVVRVQLLNRASP